jgi:hypothetical protein
MLLDRSWAVGLLTTVCMLFDVGLLYFLRVHIVSTVELALAQAPISVVI